MRRYTNGFSRLEEPCPRLLKAPFGCNGCDKKSRSSCRYHRRIYSAKQAQAAYEELLKEARTGIPLNKSSFYEIERTVSEGIKSGQHVYHMLKTDDFAVFTATVYRHINLGYCNIT